MKRILACTATALLALGSLTSANAAGKIELSWVAPEQYSDIGRNSFDREHVLKSIGQYVQTLAADLPDGQTLRLEVLDLDLAGELRTMFNRGGQEIRVLRGRADWPHMKVRYTLQDGTGTIKTGEAQLADMSYLDHTPPLTLDYGDLGYEKRMVKEWFKQTFVAH